MLSKYLVLCHALTVLTIGSAALSAQSTGAQQFNTDSLNAFASTADSFIGVFANRSEMPTGSTGFAVLNIFNFSTGQFSQCSSANFDLVVNKGRMALVFVVESAFNCSLGDRITVTCGTTPDSASFQNVISGTASVGGEQFTTHGLNSFFNNLACRIHAFGVDYVARGGAGTERLTRTP